MKTSPVVLPHCVLSHVLPPLGRMRKADLHRGFQVLVRAVVELGSQKISNERPAGAHVGHRNKEIDQPCQTPRQTNSDVQVVCG